MPHHAWKEALDYQLTENNAIPIKILLLGYNTNHVNEFLIFFHTLRSKVQWSYIVFN